MPKPACVKCGLFLRVRRNGFVIEEGMPNGSGVVRYSGVNPGEDRHHDWTGYKLWQADLWECRGCGMQMVTGYGQHPIAEHYEEGYTRARDAAGGEIIPFIHDC